MANWTEEELKKRQEEVDIILNAFKVYTHEELNLPEGNVHHAPALMASVYTLFQQWNEDSSVHMMLPEVILNQIASFGSTMFEFGQRAMKDGVLAANLSPCNCTEITDEELQKLSGN